MPARAIIALTLALGCTLLTSGCSMSGAYCAGGGCGLEACGCGHCGEPTCGGGACGLSPSAPCDTGGCEQGDCGACHLCQRRGVPRLKGCNYTGYGCGWRTWNPIGWLFSCHPKDNWCSGCGDAYYGDYISEPPDCCDPCDCFGNWTGSRAPFAHPYDPWGNNPWGSNAWGNDAPVAGPGADLHYHRPHAPGPYDGQIIKGPVYDGPMESYGSSSKRRPAPAGRQPASVLSSRSRQAVPSVGKPPRKLTRSPHAADQWRREPVH